jgi:DNA-binding SARP family transcriptional activator/tetratricopeptide (TPR) repeat protein
VAADGSGLRFRVLGPVTALRSGLPVAVGSPQRRAVLAVLLAHARRLVSVDQLVDALWLGRPPASAEAQLQGHISGLRQALGDAGATRRVIVTRSPGYVLETPEGSLDYELFRGEAHQGRGFLIEGDPGSAAALLRRALSHWRGEAFADINLPVIRHLAATMEEERQAALADRIDADLALGKHGELIGELGRLVEQRPLDERLRAQLITALHRSGRQAEALAAYRSARKVLIDELGIEPGLPLRHLHQQILDGAGTAPITAMSTGLTPRMLPPAVPDFTGRVTEQDTLLSQLRDAGKTRWILLCGPAGIGKTALALRAAHTAAQHFPDGQLFVRMRQPDGRPLPPSVALGSLLAALGFRGIAIPETLADRANLYRSAVADRAILVLADDVLEEDQARHLLPGTPSSALVLTSRSRLPGVEALSRLALTPLSPTDAHAVLTGILGPQKTTAEPAATTQLISHCAGLPLALRIAAARLASQPLLSLHHLERLLADERNRLDWLKLGDLEVRASLTLSYNHLKPPEQRLFRLLGALHAPDFPAWTANALLDDHTTAPQHLLDTLADAHLIEITPANGQTRYHLHPLVHLLATELTDKYDTPIERHTAVRRLTEGLLTTADAAARAMKQRFVLDELPNGCWMPPPEIAELARAQPVAWMSGECKTIQAVVEHAAAAGLVAQSWLLFQRVAYDLLRRNDLDTQDRLITYLLPIVRNSGDARGEAALLKFHCDFLAFRDQVSKIPAHAHRIIANRRACRDLRAEVEGRRLLGSALMNQGAWDEARYELRIALKLARRIEDHLGAANVLNALTWSSPGGVAEREYIFAEALREARLVGGNTGEFLRDFGLSLANEGRPSEALVLLKEALLEFQEAEDEWRSATVEITLAGVYVDLGCLDAAEPLLAKGRRTVLTHSDRYGQAVALFVESKLAKTRGQLGRARDLAARARMIWDNLPDPQAEALIPNRTYDPDRST